MDDHMSEIEGDDSTFKVASLGVEVEAWFRTRVGRHVLERAEEQVQEAFEKWLDVDPVSQGEIQELQNKANAARLAIIWLNEAIGDGEVAQRSLEEAS